MKLFTSYYGSRSIDRKRHFLVRISNSSPKAFTVDAVLQDAIPDWDTIVKPFDILPRLKRGGFSGD